MTYPKTFLMNRKKDETGVSGTGVILEGVLFHNGKVVVCWKTEHRPHGAASIGVYDSFDDFNEVHIVTHPGNETEVLWETS